ncbi:hypothetical protein [Nesterenkonia lutea]|uniref:Uncharacterized protein n=1 Tax=Nesterenkonia lutea TaxID=272919 RepID=A0ABR9JBS7_9MICC|nr:hypothetical protein [Nesterenkonia lutea]MBE1523399.1 hypothetical protein [Nesterenkonia lutea]
MNHDSISFDTVEPISHRTADIRDAYDQITRRGLEVAGGDIECNPGYRSNENGHFAWDMSLLVRAACLTWRVTRDPLHLQQAVTWARHMVERTDEALGLVNWRGCSGPVWSAGSRYTAGTARVGAIGGTPIRIQAVADRVIIERPSETTAIVRAVREGGRTWSSPVVSLLPKEHNYLPDVLGRLSASFSVQVRGLPAPVDLTSLIPGEYSLEPQMAAHFVHTGMIVRSLLCVTQELESAGSNAIDVTITPGELLAAGKRALLFHDDEIRTRSGQAWYITPVDFPGRRLGLELPHNHVVDAATAFLILGRRLGDKSLHNHGASLTRRFLSEIEAYRSGALRHPWFYYPVTSEIFSGVTRDEPMAERSVPAVPRGEDSSHATMRVRALTEWKAFDSRLVPDRLLSTVALSFRRHYMSNSEGVVTLRWLPGDGKDSPRRGRTDAYAGAWGTLSPWDPSIKRRINSMAHHHPPTEIFGATVLSAAEIFAMNAGIPTYASSDRTARA